MNKKHTNKDINKDNTYPKIVDEVIGKDATLVSIVHSSIFEGLADKAKVRQANHDATTSQDPTTSAFNPVNSSSTIVETKTICFASRSIGVIEGVFLIAKSINPKSVNIYLSICNDIDYEGDEDIMAFIKRNYLYEYVDGKHAIK